jgi:ATP/maltotriose-dependent transcriptional regulator MalT
LAGPSRTLEAARSAFERHRWAAAHEGFVAAREQGPISADDVAALAECAWWQGAIEECLSAYEEAYRLFLHGEQPGNRQAAMLAMEIGFFWYLRGEMAIGSGWLSRAHRLLEAEPECVEQGYLLSMSIDEAIAQGELNEAIAVAREVAAIAYRYEDETLTALALVGEGVAMIKQGRVPDGMAILDEAMLPVVAGRVDAAYAGNIYCQVMSVCHELSDLRRAQQWTEATTKWCKGFTHAVMFLGICRVHRAQLMQVQGQWAQAEEEARRVCEELAAMSVVAVGLGQYELAEVRRLRGDLAGAEVAYGRAHQLGRDPQPGLALLWLAQGRTDAALDTIRAAVGGGSVDRLALARLWCAEVEIALAAGDLDDARRASRELDQVAAAYGSSGLVAAAVQARGAVLLAEGDAEAAVVELVEACRHWQELDAPYRVAQVRTLLGRAHRALGNEQAAELELDAAAKAFERLGATVDAARVEALRSRPPLPDGLTAREVEVLALVATGSTNKEVAETLFLSEKTVARHLSNIFTKLDISSRTAAAAYAFEHSLASPPRG